MPEHERSYRISDRMKLFLRPVTRNLVAQGEFILMAVETEKKATLATGQTDFGKNYSNLLIEAYRSGITLSDDEKVRLRDAIQDALGSSAT